MSSLGSTLAGLRKYGALARALSPAPAARPQAPSRLREVHGFGSNPGDLRMFEYVPQRLAPAPALVVVLHGCTQTAAAYDHGTGWSRLADRHGFVLVFPEQTRANNPRTCFNWFLPGDTRRDAGEALSIREMVRHAAAAHGVDTSRVFVTGLSAGGAMTAVMLATYPEVFSAGAILAGLPYGSAASVREALDAMFQGVTRPAPAWGELVRGASPHRGPWPRISVWHGDADTTVKPTNASEIVKQWNDVHGIAGRPALESKGTGYIRHAWTDDGGRALVESVTIPGMAHGAPLAVGEDADGYGVAGPFLLDVGVSSTYEIARFFGVAPEVERERVADPIRRPAPAGPAGEPKRDETPRPEPHVPGRFPVDVPAVIAKALRAAGLMR